MHAILTIAVGSELDVIASRQRARQIAAFCGFGLQDQARIATAVSELARNIFNYAPAGKVRFSLSQAAPRQALVVVIEDNGPGIADLELILAGDDQPNARNGGGLPAARRLVDQCEIATGNNGTNIVLTKWLPAQAPTMTMLAIGDAVAQLHALPSNVALSEAHQQNRELTDALATLQVRQDELVEVSHRLEETNEQVETLNRLLNEKAESLMSADRQKNEFLSMLSHELRGPLSAASMAAHLLEKDPAAPEQTVNLSQLINRQIGHMSRLVEDLLDVSRVSRGLLSIVKAAVDMREVIEAAVEQVMPAARRKGHAINLALPATACVVNGDQTRLVQVIGNLLGNAIRYTPNGGKIELVMRVRDAALSVTVTDNGMGIPADLLPHLFDLYMQAEHSSDSKNGGLGLGLALVKSLVELHDGEVRASSDGRGCGSTFEISLLLAQPASSLASH
jgi:signal transduction histidine kinase